MDIERTALRAVGMLVDSSRRHYTLLEASNGGEPRRLVLQRGIALDSRRLRKRLASLGVYLPSEGRTVRDLVVRLSNDGDLPHARVSDHLGWVEVEGLGSVFLLDTGYVDRDGWHDTLTFAGPHPSAPPGPAVPVVSDAALWQPARGGSAWEGHDKPPTAPHLDGWKPRGTLSDWLAWFDASSRVVRTAVCAALAPVVLRGVRTGPNLVVSLVGRSAYGVLQAAVSPWAGPPAGLFWPDARLQDLERHAARMGELPLAYQEADATSRDKLLRLVHQYAAGSTSPRAKSDGDLLPTRRLTGTLLLESQKPLMTPESGLQDATLQFCCTETTAAPVAAGVAGVHLALVALQRTTVRIEALRAEFGRLTEDFYRKRVALGYNPSRTWRLDARHAAVELTYRAIADELGSTKSTDTDGDMYTEWREPMIAAGEAEGRRAKPS